MSLLRAYFFPGLLLILFVPHGSMARQLDVIEQEIDHLLVFVEHSPCVFVRNGTSYTGGKARAHIQKKLNYISKRKQEITTEQFIKYAASQSSLSKKPYTVQCGSKTITSENWLTEELARYRRLSILDNAEQKGN